LLLMLLMLLTLLLVLLFSVPTSPGLERALGRGQVPF
jgi:hypothetical protein